MQAKTRRLITSLWHVTLRQLPGSRRGKHLLSDDARPAQVGGHRTLRMLHLGAHAARSAARSSREPVAGPGQVARNPARAMYRMVVTSALIATAAAVVAAKSSRLRRVVFAAFAVPAAGMSAWTRPRRSDAARFDCTAGRAIRSICVRRAPQVLRTIDA
jgi:hypothetical protein